MHKISVFLLTVFLASCGSSSTNTEPPKQPVIVEPVGKDTIVIHSNTDNKSLSGSSIDNQAIIINATYSQAERDKPGFSLLDSVILGENKNCIDCFSLSKFFDFYHRDNNIQIFITVQDSLTLGFVEAILSNRGYQAVLVSSDEQLLLSSQYNYELALIGETSNANIDWHITDNKDCSAKCISPINTGLGEFDAVID